MNRLSIIIGLVLAALCARADIAPPQAVYYELRIYDVTSNKLDAVVERFQHTVEPVRQKHGISTLGYWTASATNGDKFVYLMTAPTKEALKEKEKAFGADPQFKEGYATSNRKYGKTVEKIASLPMAAGPGVHYDFSAAKKPRVFDLRIYSVLPGKLDAFRNRWRDHAVPVYERHGLHSVGWWIADQKYPDGNDRFICLLAGESIDTIQKSIAAFHKDPEWQAVEKESERDGKLRSEVEALKLTPASFSPLK